ncbi:MAG: SMI1/KNR4 family protein [Clostridia bacterium]|nr:SMI1/KNR4 family protein [Clostridia bacterium]
MMNTENLWLDSEYSKENCISEPFDDEMLKSIEAELGYKLPASYVELMREHNGGILNRGVLEIGDTYTIVSTLYGIGREKSYSLGGSYSTKFWVEEWGYPDIGIAIAETESAGHEMIFLDYTECGPEGEPRVVYIDQEWDYKTIVVAENFEEFVNMLREDDEY